jgi:hypothetical protein
MKGALVKLEGKLYLEGKLVKNNAVAVPDEEGSFRDRLEKCLLELCAVLEIPVPLWLKKNTKELGAFRRTFFSSEQFIEKVWFDKLEIILSS